MAALFGLGSNPVASAPSRTLAEASCDDPLPSDAELEKIMFSQLLRASSTGEGLLTTSNTPALDGEMVFANQVAEQPVPHSPVLRQIKCQSGWANQTMSPPLAVGKVYRADHHVYPLQLGDSRNPSEGCVSELIGAFYPKSPLAANSPHTPFVPPAATPGRTGSGLNMVSTWAGTGAPQTSAAQFGQQQPDSPQLQHVPPPPPPRPAPQDGPKQEQHLQKLKYLEERERVILQYLEQLRMDRALVMRVHAENQAEGNRHAIAKKEIEEQAQVLRRAAHQQQVKEAELEGREEQVERARQVLQQAEASFMAKRQQLQEEVEALNLAKQVQALLKSASARSTAESAVQHKCPTCLDRAQSDHAQAAPTKQAPGGLVNSGTNMSGTMAQHLRAIALNGHKIGSIDGVKGVQAGKNQPAASSNTHAVPASSPYKGTIKVLYRGRT